MMVNALQLVTTLLFLNGVLGGNDGWWNRLHQPWGFVSRGGGSAEPSSPYEIVNETEVYSRWRTITRRIIRLKNGKVVDFDIVGQAGSDRAALIFAWNSTSKTATMIREYMPGANHVQLSLAAGLVEGDKHNDTVLTAAQYELEEECHLVGGKWIQLTAKDAIMDKYCTTRLQVFLVIDAEEASNPRPLDDEEEIEIVPSVSIPTILESIENGEMSAVGGWASLLAIHKLREMGQI